MGSESNTDVFRFNALSKSDHEGYFSADADGTYVINYLPGKGNKFHETKHAAQVNDLKMAAIPGTKTVRYSNIRPIESEVEAYRIQFAIDPGSMPRSDGKYPKKISEVTSEYVRGIYYIKDHKSVYPYGGEMYKKL